MYQYPYGNAQQLNLDWILSKLQELEAGSGGGGDADLEEIANALVSASFDAGVAYRRYDYCFYNGKLYRALNDNQGAFNPSDWMEITLGADIPVLTRLINAVDASLTTLQGQVADLDSDDVDNASSVVSGATVTNALDNLNSAIKYLFISTPSQVGLSGTPTLSALVNAMPNYSLAYINTAELDLTGLTDYADVNIVQVIKLTPGRIFAIGARSNLNVTDAQSKIYFATYSHNDYTWHGFFELARLSSVNSEATTRSNADIALGNRITQEVTDRENADTALTNSINALKKNNLTNITNFTTGDYPESNPFVAPSDGYLFLSNSSGETARFLIYGAEQNTAYLQLGYTEGRFSMFVRAGLKIALNGTASTARFVALS